MATIKEFAIVKAIMAVLKLDDAGKISKFFSQEVKNAEEAIEGLKLNLQVEELNRKQAVSKSDKAIEDATNEVEAAYQNVKPENVATNKLMTDYSYEYWQGVQEAEYKLANLKEQAKAATESFDKKVERINDQIAKYQVRIDKISA
jgi:ABC-type Fe2+-enterobactin transport system substrate-binding protein